MIPAHNEARRIKNVLEPLLQVGTLDQIIVVDDASSDGTAEVVQAFKQHEPRLKIVRLPEKLGKAGAMTAGAGYSVQDLVVFLDADLVGLRPEHVKSLIDPVRRGEADMTLGLFIGMRYHTDWSHRLTPFLSGQRCLRWSLFKKAPELSTAEGGAEVALSLYAHRHGYRVQRVSWPGVTHAIKLEKEGVLHGLRGYITMYAEILRYLLKYSLFAPGLAEEEAKVVQSSKGVKGSRGLP